MRIIELLAAPGEKTASLAAGYGSLELFTYDRAPTVLVARLVIWSETKENHDLARGGIRLIRDVKEQELGALYEGAEDDQKLLAFLWAWGQEVRARLMVLSLAELRRLMPRDFVVHAKARKPFCRLLRQKTVRTEDDVRRQLHAWMDSSGLRPGGA